MTLPQLLRIRWAVRATLLLGVAASVVANVLHAVDNPISQAIAAWPPFALLLTVELISRVPVHRRSLAFIRMVATTAIAGIAAWISYWHMAGVAAKYGETGASAYLLPISVDGLIVVASICLIELGGRIAEAQAAKRAATEATAAEAAAGTAATAGTPTAAGAVRTSAAGTAATAAIAGTATVGDTAAIAGTAAATAAGAADGEPVLGPDGLPTARPGADTAAPIGARGRTDTSAPVVRAPHSGAGEEWFGERDRLTDDDVPGIAALVPRPLTGAAASADTYSQFTGAVPEHGYAADDHHLTDAADRRRTADRLAAGGAMAVAAGARRDRDPLTTTGSQPMLASDVAAAVEAALNGRPVARGVRGGASPRSRAGISAASGSLTGRGTGPDDAGSGALVPGPSVAPGNSHPDEPRQNGQPSRPPAPRAETAATRTPARTSAATSATRQTATGRVTARTGPGRVTGTRADGNDSTPTADAAGIPHNGTEHNGTGHNGTGHNGTAPNGTGAARPRRSTAETAALAADIEARHPGISEAAVAGQLGITPRRLREVRRVTDTRTA
ncbi:DUF2637 domain-containing protein [Catenuloplanes indicus]|uniref:DUF2637 domain-containing protein n=1 Tax=Catenuloplanes indicus TaxID=137267 RepID=A0AAE3W6G2_9ACTN|nr:DUF2637 domain-containing protein [Catenuloplanes indicus]MDQ0369280.1 hypothetical protein [Catenuloplanes indicus]